MLEGSNRMSMASWSSSTQSILCVIIQLFYISVDKHNTHTHTVDVFFVNKVSTAGVCSQFNRCFCIHSRRCTELFCSTNVLYGTILTIFQSQ